MQPNNVIDFDPLLPQENEAQKIANTPNPQQFALKKQQKSFLEKWNTFMIENYLILIIISFALIFVIVPFIIFNIKRARYTHLFKDDSDGILQPFNEAREFRWMQLNNGMNVVLVSDSESSNSGAALEIDVGSSYDPKEVPGLAHFLEHMLFMGSKKYHNVSHFKDFISLNGGKTNAFTSDEYTKFYFTVNNAELDAGLEIFSRFFIDPLFDSTRVEKEILAVHNEYEMNLQKNIWRFFELLRRNSNSDHSFHRFTCGNLKTLKILPEQKHLKIQDEVVKFFENYYSSHKMKLVVIGNQNLDTLEKMVVDKFTQIKNKKNTFKMPDHLINMPQAYPSNLLGKFIWYKTIGNQKLISIVFPIKINKTIDPKVNPIDYLSHVICLDGENSLKWNLLKKGWITNLETNVIQKTPDFLHFAVMISLSEIGISNSLAIIEEFFSWIKIIMKQGVNKKLYKQFMTISYLNFLFSRKKSLEDDLINLVSNLNALSHQEIPFEHILTHKEILMKYNGNAIRDLLQEFTAEKSLIILGAGDLEIDKIINNDKFKAYFNESNEDISLMFKQKEFLLDNFDFDKEIFQNMQKRNSKTFVLKPAKHTNTTNNLIKFKESIFIDKNHMNFNQLMQETFTSCDYASPDPYELKVNNNFYDNEFSTSSNEMFPGENIFKTGNLLKCSSDSNDSLHYYKKLNKFDEIMKIHYSSEKINNTWLAKINQTTSNFDNFNFEIPNRFLPTNYALKSNCSFDKNETFNNKSISSTKTKTTKFLTKRPDFIYLIKDLFEDFDENEIKNSLKSQCFFDELVEDLNEEFPIKIAKNISKSNIWLKTDRTFLVPKIDLKIFMRINGINNEKEKVILGVIVDIINSRNKELLYDAYLLKYQANLIAHQKGIEFQINGFSDKVSILVQKLFENFENFFEKMTGVDFDAHLSDIKNYYENLNKAQALQQLQKHLQKILRKNYLCNKEILNYLETISFDDLKQFMVKVFDNYKMNMLFVGNILPSEANELAYNITNNMPNKSYPHNILTNTTYKKASILNITDKFNSVFVANNSNVDDENNAIINYYQIGERNDANYVKSVVISTLLNTEAFNFLRTEKQLGYVVHSNIFSLKNIDGFLIGIQGSNNAPDVMNKYIEEFLFKFFEIISNKTETQFKNILKHISHKFLFKDPDITSLSERLWEEVSFGKNDFKKYDRYYKKIGKLTKVEILKFFQKIFKINSKKISLQLFKNSSNSSENYKLNLTENYGGRQEKIVTLEDLSSWDYFQKSE